ncbi:MAG: C39 family peptidase [Dehalococcoidia bacterium]|nr:C39 family peptidase [Dehalococcoidia bacterium]
MDKRFLSLAVLAVVAILSPSAVITQPNVYGFYGSVTFDGVPAARGTMVKVWVDDGVVKPGTTDMDCSICVDGKFAGKTLSPSAGVRYSVVAQTLTPESGVNKKVNPIATTAIAPDLIITDIWTNSVAPSKTQMYSITAVVKPVGNQRADAGFRNDQHVTFYVDGVKVSAASYDAVNPGGSIKVISPLLVVPPSGSHDITACADAENDILESNEENNCRSEPFVFPQSPAPRQLQVPYYNQADTSWCWATSLSMILEYYGYDRKPWQIAADFDKGPDEALNGFDSLGLLGMIKVENYVETYYSAGMEGAWELDCFRDNSSFVREIQMALASGHPVWVLFWDQSHVIVATGFDGVGPSDHVYVNDPSGWLTGWDTVQHQFTWSEFASLIDTKWSSPFGDVELLYAKVPQLQTAHNKATIEVQPGDMSFTTLAEGNKHQLTLRWDGMPPYSGYRYEVSAGGTDWYQKDTDGEYDNYGFNATQADTLTVIPRYANYAIPDTTCYLRTIAEIRRANDNSLVWSEPFGVETVFAKTDQLGYDTTIFKPLLDIPPGTYKLVLRLEGNVDNQNTWSEFDRCEFYFGVTASPSANVDRQPR